MKPDFDDNAEDLFVVLAHTFQTEQTAKKEIAQVLRAAYDAGLERAAEMLIENADSIRHLETSRNVYYLDMVAKAIRAEKED